MNEYKVGKFRNRFVLLVFDFSVALMYVTFLVCCTGRERERKRERVDVKERKGKKVIGG